MHLKGIALKMLMKVITTMHLTHLPLDKMAAILADNIPKCIF